MAESPFIAARFRNPSEVDATKVKGKPKQDYIGGIVAILAFVVAAATLTFIYLDWATLMPVQ